MNKYEWTLAMKGMIHDILVDEGQDPGSMNHETVTGGGKSAEVITFEFTWQGSKKRIKISLSEEDV